MVYGGRGGGLLCGQQQWGGGHQLMATLDVDSLKQNKLVEESFEEYSTITADVMVVDAPPSIVEHVAAYSD